MIKRELNGKLHKIYTIDLHGNSKKKETTPDGGKDENVFDIMQGVSINVFVKTGKKKPKELGKVFHYDLYGKREEKYQFLINDNFRGIPFKAIPNISPMYYMVPKDFEVQEIYDVGFNVAELFPNNNVGVVTSRDKFVIDENRELLEERITDFFLLEKDQLKRLYSLKENQSWKIDEVKRKASPFDSTFIKPISYRPFDERFIYFDSDFIERSRPEITSEFLKGDNYGLLLCRQTAVDSWEHISITNKIADDSRVSNRSKERGYILPLYTYTKDLNGGFSHKPNLNEQIVETIAKNLNYAYIPDDNLVVDLAAGYDGTLYPLDILDYIYAVLHSPSYREKYKEFLKIDFPRVPYPKDAETFDRLVELGRPLREIHLLESPAVESFITTYPVGGDNKVTRKITKNSPGFELSDKEKQLGKVWINEEQYFDKVRLSAWEFYIGGYQPAQKWLKDRSGRILGFEDILHYQKIIVALKETERLMGEIDKIDL